MTGDGRHAGDERVLHTGHGRRRRWSQSKEESGPRRKQVVPATGVDGVDGTVDGELRPRNGGDGFVDFDRGSERALVQTASGSTTSTVVRFGGQTRALAHGGGERARRRVLP